MIKKRNSRYNKRKKSLTERLKPLAKILAVFITLGLGIWGVVKIMDTSFLKAEIEWEIDKKLPIAQTVLEKYIHSLIKDKYQFDTNAIKQMLENQPWIAKVHISSQLFSNKIQINITSQKIAMRWRNIDCKTDNAPNCTGYISSNGVLFMPEKTITSNVALAHSKADQETIAQLYQDYQQYQNTAKKMLIKSFFKTHIDTLIFKPNIKVILGYQQQQPRLIRFLKAYKGLRKKISRKKLNKATFDMRYPKGFSLNH
ncbi:MAG: FtsQ-type POTRA domain-containing protein [Gammaproteobacteria bacterium]|nr:FtsQ-type POTRA domain-containing protein [Gammaproteobacteria bacterium]